MSGALRKPWGLLDAKGFTVRCRIAPGMDLAATTPSRLRRTETLLARFTLTAAAVFAVIETIASWQMFGGPTVLVHPGYIGSVAGIVLLFAGAQRSLRARPRPAPALMCASHAWWTGVGWHAASLRFTFVQQGTDLFYGPAELWATVGGAALVASIFGLSLYLTCEAESLCTRRSN